MNRLPKFIYFRQGIKVSGEVLDYWIVQAKKDDAQLGTIEWYKPWKCFVFEAEEDAVFEHVCLRDIADHMERETKRRKAKQSKAAG